MNRIRIFMCGENPLLVVMLTQNAIGVRWLLCLKTLHFSTQKSTVSIVPHSVAENLGVVLLARRWGMVWHNVMSKLCIVSSLV